MPPPDKTAEDLHPPRTHLVSFFNCCSHVHYKRTSSYRTLDREGNGCTPTRCPRYLSLRTWSPLAVNEAFTKLLAQLVLGAKELLRGHLSEDDLFTHLEKGNCAVRYLTVGEHEHYTFHLIRLDLSACKSCICCMLVPNGESWNSHPTEFLSFEENQRSYLTCVLKRTDGKVSGQGGAAEILKMHPQTLFSKMKKLGLKR